ncbi:MAG: prepilin peptidase [Chloroflexota bacterium]
MVFSLAVPMLVGFVSAGATNYLADELPRTRRLSRPACSKCGTDYGWADYLAARACRNCGHPRGLRPWVVLGSMLALSTFTWLQPHRMGYGLAVLLLTYFAVVVVIDMEHRLILRPTSILGAVLAAGIGWRLHGPVPTLLGGLAGFALMSAFYYLGVLFARLRARRLEAAGSPADNEEALGGGDVTLAGILGLLLGWPLIWFGLLLGVLLGGFIGLIIVLVALLRGVYGRQALMLFMPYGPSFVLSAFLIMFLPNVIAGFLPR